MSEQIVREKWDAFCEAARALVADGYRVEPGRNLEQAVAISETSAVKKAAETAPKVKVGSKPMSFGLKKEKQTD